MTDDLELRVTIGDLLDSQTELFAQRDALVHVEAGTRLTYQEFKDCLLYTSPSPRDQTG